MGTQNQSAYQPTLVASSQPNMPDRADRTAIMGGTIVVDIANVSESEATWDKRESQPVTPSSEHLGAYGSNYGDSFIFERIWVQPLAIDFGFIVEDSQEYIQIWNASRFDPAEVSDILVTNPEGTQLTYDPLPNSLPIFGDVNYLLEVFNIGPPLQDTTYRFTVDGVDYDVELSGIRVIPFDLDPNWDAGIQIGYEFQSTIFTSRRLNEQRRPLSRDSWFVTGFRADTSSGRSRLNFNSMSYGKDKVFGVPVFLEKMELSSCTKGSYSVLTTEDVTKMYNLNNRTEYIILVDHINGLSEVKLVNTIAPGVLTLKQPISADFNSRTTFAYPCMFCFLKSFQGSNETDDFTEISVDFQQYKS